MAIINGTEGADYLTGTAGDDQIKGGAGDDGLHGGSGDDVIEGEDGGDYIDGDYGNDVLRGGDGDDFIDDGSDSSSDAAFVNEMYGDGGNDVITVYLPGTNLAHTYLMDGGSGNDRISFSAWYYTHFLTVKGGEGDDRIEVHGAKSLIVDAGAGNDVIAFNFSGSTTQAKLTLGAGSDLVVVARERFTSNPNPVALQITDFEAGAGGDRITVESFLRLLSGWDTATNPFATGHLTLEQRGADAVLRVDFDGGANSYQDLVIFEGVAASALGISNVGFASDGSDAPGLTLDGDSSANSITGFGHDDVIRGHDGDDTLSGSSGDDLIEGGLGTDVIDGGWGSDRLYGEDGDDTLSDINSGNDELYGGEGNDELTVQRGSSLPFSTLLLDGGAGNDALGYAPYNEVPYRRFVDDVTALGGAGKDTIRINSPRNAIIDAGADSDYVSISTHAGSSFTITLGSGADTLALESSRVSNASIIVTDWDLGTGGDRLDMENLLSSTLVGWDRTTNPYETGFLQLIQRGDDAVLQIDRDAAGSASTFSDLILFKGRAASGFTSNNLGGFSSLTGTGSGERIEGDDGSNYIRGLGGDDILIGHSGHDGLIGGDGDDQLDGGEGKDRLDGGAGADTMTGGRGDDLYFVDDIGDLVIETSDEGDTSDEYSNNETDEVRTTLSSYVLPTNVGRLIGLASTGQTLTANAGDNLIRSGDGDDFLYLLDGNDTAWGGMGADRIEGGTGSDSLFGGAGSDTLLGGDGNDYLYAAYQPGPAGDDRLEGGAGDDRLRGDAGSDVLLGGDGNDYIEESASGTDLIDGGNGDDYLYIHRGETMAALASTLIGGEGNDHLSLNVRNGSLITVDLGAGADKVVYYASSGAKGAVMNVTLGSGQDVVTVSDYVPNFDATASLVIADFEAGASGDRLDIAPFLKAWLTGWDKVSDPFASGHMRLVQSGADTLLQVDRNGGGDSYLTLMTLANFNAASLTSYNLGGFEAPVVQGSAAGDTLRGTSGDDRFDGLEGDDLLRLDQGGDDTALGGAGKDAIIFGSTLTSADIVDGGSEVDQLSIQGDYWAAKKLTLGNVTNVEQIILLAGSNTAFGDPGTGFYSYELTTQDLNVAAGGLLQVDANQLRAGENFTFNGAAETDGAFFVWGGKGVDSIVTGAGNDGFLFRGSGNWGSSDVVNAGAGTDQVGIRGNYVGAGAIVMGANQLASVEQLVLMSGSDIRFGRLTAPTSYDITMNDGNVASGQRMTVDAASLREGETLTFNASAELDGAYTVFGGRSADTIIGGAGADVLRGARGGDTLTGGGGADTFGYRAATESTGVNYDTLVDLASVDRIDLPTAVSSFAQSVTTGQLNNATFDADLAAALDGVLEANQAVLFTASSGDHAGKRFLIVDGNGDGAYTEGTDYVFALGASAVIDTSSAAVFV